MTKKICLTMAVALTLVFTGAAWAGHINLPVKWSQRPDIGQVHGELSVVGLQVVADDWMCLDPRDVAAVRWWGTYMQPGGPGAPAFKPFQISFHNDLPANQNPAGPFSQPQPPDSYQTVYAQEDFFGYFGVTPIAVYEYNAYVPTPWRQTPGTIYWLDVAAVVTTPFWYWVDTHGVWNDVPVTWTPVQGYRPLNCEDQAFELMVVPLPGALWLLGSGLIGLLGVRRFRK